MKKEEVFYKGCTCYSFGAFLWGAAFLSLIFSWIANRNGVLFTLEASDWYANALIFGVLAIPLKMKGGHCSHCRAAAIKRK
jgi:hypothetical protein